MRACICKPVHVRKSYHNLFGWCIGGEKSERFMVLASYITQPPACHRNSSVQWWWYVHRPSLAHWLGGTRTVRFGHRAQCTSKANCRPSVWHEWACVREFDRLFQCFLYLSRQMHKFRWGGFFLLWFSVSWIMVTWLATAQWIVLLRSERTELIDVVIPERGNKFERALLRLCNVDRSPVDLLTVHMRARSPRCLAGLVCSILVRLVGKSLLNFG